MPVDGVLSVTVPGAVDALVRLSEDWGRAGLVASLAPAIRYADEGVPVSPRTALDWGIAAARLTGDARRFYLDDGRPLQPGQVFAAPGQAEVLRRIAREGRAGFYEGEVAQDMVSSLQALGGSHTLEDFAATACEYVEPLSGMYRGHELVELPPNGQGATAILMAKILSHFEMAGLDPMGAARAHLEAEAARLAYDARNRFVADPGHARQVSHMLGDETAARLAGLIDLGRAMEAPEQLSEAVHRETVYLTVVDRDRMAVSLIYSIFHSFGSGLASARFGINFQNRGAGFTLARGHANEAGGGKRPMHTIIPAMLKKDGRVLMSFGVMGGQYQAAGHVRFISNLIDFGMDPQQAIDAPRSFPDGADMQLETGYSDAVAAELVAMGHKVTRRAMPLGGAQSITIDEPSGVLAGASDARKDGCALGY
jgi:gamma-glutamyltranspeptidase/glutathione hydrolase